MLSEEQRQRLRSSVAENWRAVTDMLVRIDVEQAKAMVAEDHAQLSVRSAFDENDQWRSCHYLCVCVQEEFQAMEGGYHRANVELKAYLRDGWVLPAMPGLVDESAAALGSEPSEDAQRQHAQLCGSVGTILKKNGSLSSRKSISKLPPRY